MNGHHIGVIASSRQDTVTPPTWTNLISWWKMAETSGGIAYDSEGSDDGTVNDATQTSGGVVFDGTNDSIDVDGTTFGVGTFTIIMRVTPSDASARRECIWGGATNALAIDIFEGDTLYMGKTGATHCSPSTALNPDEENFLAIVRNGTSVRFFINDNTVEVEDWSYLSATIHVSASTSIGEDTSGGDDDFTGTINNLCCFSDAKSDAYIAAFYNSGSYTEYEDGDPA